LNREPDAPNQALMLASFSPLSTDLCSCHWQVVELGRIVISMTPTLKRILLAAFSLLALLVTAAGLYLWREVKRPKRVWVAYSEKERVREGETEELPSGETAIFAQQRISWLMSSNTSCLALTNNKSRADYLVNISVIRYRDGKVFGEATLSIVKANGDLVLVDQFHQDAKSAEDIAEQPITAAWSALCMARK
jgi:hypothetical protein